MGLGNGEGKGGSGPWWEMEYDGAWMAMICSRFMVPYLYAKVRRWERKSEVRQSPLNSSNQARLTAF